MSISELEALIDSGFPTFRTGDIVNGTILEIRPQVVLVDIGYKSEGVISISEFEDEEIEVGDQIEVLLESLENVKLRLILIKSNLCFNTDLGIANHKLEAKKICPFWA